MYRNAKPQNTKLIHEKRQLQFIKYISVTSRYFKGLELMVDLHRPAGIQVRAIDAEPGLYVQWDDVLEGALLGHYNI